MDALGKELGTLGASLRRTALGLGLLAVRAAFDAGVEFALNFRIALPPPIG